MFGRYLCGYLVLLGAFAAVAWIENIHLTAYEMIGVIWGPLLVISAIDAMKNRR